MARPLQATIDLDAIKKNYLLAKQLHPSCKAFAVVKSDAYGHGAVRVATHIEEEVDAFAVASIEEARELRDAGIATPILLLEGVFESLEWSECDEKGFWTVIENTEQLRSFLETKPKIEKVFVKLDTGMHRLGFRREDLQQTVETIETTGLVGEVVLMTHFSCADDLSNLETIKQLTLFEDANQSIGSKTSSVANSAAILKWTVPEGGWIRPGIMLYGISPFAEVSGEQLGLKPAMTLTSKVISVREVKAGESVGYGLTYTATEPHQLATVAVGYGDGYPRSAENGTPVVVGSMSDELAGELAGRVSMDMITVKLSSSALSSANAALEVGQSVELWGRQVPVEEVAHMSGTIGYELVTRMTKRPKRIYVEAENEPNKESDSHS